MEYRRLGSAGLKVSVLSFGSWVSFKNQLGTDSAYDCMVAAYDAGVNFFDNAEAYAGGESEVPVDLEWRMGIEHIRIGPPGLERGLIHQTDLPGHQSVGVVAIEEPRPEIDLPVHGPAGGRITAVEQRRPGRIEQLWRPERRDLAGWKDAI